MCALGPDSKGSRLPAGGSLGPTSPRYVISGFGASGRAIGLLNTQGNQRDQPIPQSTSVRHQLPRPGP